MTLAPILAYGLSEGVVRGLNLAILPLLTRLFTPAQFGEIALLSTVMGLVGLLANCGLGNAVHRFYFEPAVTPGLRAIVISSGFWTLAILCVGLVSGAYIFLWAVSSIEFFRFPQLTLALVLCLVAVIPTQLVQFGQDVLRVYSAHWRYCFISILKTAVALAIGLSLVYWSGVGVAAYFFGILVAQFLILIWIVSTLSDSILHWPRMHECISMLKYGTPFVAAGLAQWMMVSSDLWVLGVLSEPSDVGVYALSQKFAAIVSFATTAFGLAWSPEVLRMHAEEPNYRSIAGSMLIRIAYCLFFFATVFSAIIPYVISWMIPVEYGNTSLVTTILAFSAAIMGTCQVTILGMVFEKRSDLIAKINWAVAVVSVGLSWFLVSMLGVLGAAVSNLLASLMLTSCYFIVTHRIHALIYPGREVRLLMAFSVCCLISVAVMNIAAESTFGAVVKLVILSGLSLWLLQSMHRCRLLAARGITR